MIPQTFEQWKDCIENKCKIVLTSEYVNSRLLELADDSNTNTILFIEKYGKEHKNNILLWFNRVK